ncbi:hypothetical protein HDU99_007812 [Rhizoclosmatium hyalinum]|nr:hypothetical protein HDU99_007812 [Rhizoclosmatium hyalinum]
MSISSSVSGYSGIGTGGAVGRDLLSNELDAVRLSVANKSDEDLFLEEEAEGLEDLNEEEMRRIEAEMDAMLAEDK